MTHEQQQSLRDDIAYMKALAAEGAKTPLLGGWILVSAGLSFGAGSVFHWALVAGVLNLPEAALAVGWGLAGLVFFATLFLVTRRIGRAPGARSPVNKAAGTAWMGVGLSIFALAIALVSLSLRTGVDHFTPTFPSLIFALYGAGWAVSAAMTGKRWIWAVSIGAWAFSVLVAQFAGDPAQYLVYAAGLVCLATVPGFVLTREEPGLIV